MAWLDDLLGKNILLDGVFLPDRKKLNFVQGDGIALTVEDNTTLGSTDVTISGSVGESVTVDQSPTVDDSGARYNNVAASGDINVNLPANPPVGTIFYLRVASAYYLKFTANTGQTIQMDAIVTASAGYVRSNYVGAYLCVEAVSTTKWFVTALGGPWSADS